MMFYDVLWCSMLFCCLKPNNFQQKKDCEDPKRSEASSWIGGGVFARAAMKCDGICCICRVCRCQHGGAEKGPWRLRMHGAKVPCALLIPCWSPWYGHFWTLLAAFGRFWTLLAAFGHFWTLLDTFGHFWTHHYHHLAQVAGARDARGCVGLRGLDGILEIMESSKVFRIPLSIDDKHHSTGTKLWYEWICIEYEMII